MASGAVAEEAPQRRLLGVDDLAGSALGARGRVAGRGRALAARSVGLLAELVVGRAAASACLADGPAQSVEKPPGSMSVTLMPKPATSWASAWLKPSSAHFDAWYMPMFGNARDPADRGHLQDVARALLAQERQRGLGHPERAEQVGLDLVAGVGLAELLDHAELPVAGVVDDDVEPAEVLVRLRDGGEVGRAVGDVERERQHRVAVLLRRGRRGSSVAGGRGDASRRARGRRSPTRGRSRGTCR